MSDDDKKDNVIKYMPIRASTTLSESKPKEIVLHDMRNVTPLNATGKKIEAATQTPVEKLEDQPGTKTISVLPKHAVSIRREFMIARPQYIKNLPLPPNHYVFIESSIGSLIYVEWVDITFMDDSVQRLCRPVVTTEMKVMS